MAGGIEPLLEIRQPLAIELDDLLRGLLVEPAFLVGLVRRQPERLRPVGAESRRNIALEFVGERFVGRRLQIFVLLRHVDQELRRFGYWLLILRRRKAPSRRMRLSRIRSTAPLTRPRGSRRADALLTMRSRCRIYSSAPFFPVIASM